MIRDDFPILKNNPGIAFFDSTASSQKPSYVIDGIKEFLENDYSNIHRGAYILAERSEEKYVASKQKVCEFLNGNSWREVIYTSNSTYALNILSSTLRRNNFFEKGDKVIVSIAEHHANVVPWLILKEEIGIELEYVNMTDDFELDLDDLESKLDERVKVVSLTHVSNVIGTKFSIESVSQILNNKYTEQEKPLFVVDASQSFPHFSVDVAKLGCDFLFFTGHKVMADSGIGVLWGKKEILENLRPSFSGGGAIGIVNEDSFTDAGLPDKFECGTPNMTGAYSILRALEYIENIGGFKKIEEIEDDLTSYFLQKTSEIPEMKILGKTSLKNRVGVFTFSIDGVHSLDLADYLAEKNICVRAGKHCAEPLMTRYGLSHSCRASMYLYNNHKDIDNLFDGIKSALNEFKN